ncbi:hypothetical protein R2F61_08450 [Mollicutes bacterium LVI A0078]|nr:hypothetical protein RZE84_08225 [Mollicutes bacterium LVI A0075]WOO90739.1 hypothetical protein R2F61_08450 [Mollicutes bacterium LVI A0078]
MKQNKVPATVGKTYSTGKSCDVSFSTKTKGYTRDFLRNNSDYRWQTEKILIISKPDKSASKLEAEIQKTFKIFGN